MVAEALTPGVKTTNLSIAKMENGSTRSRLHGPPRAALSRPARRARSEREGPECGTQPIRDTIAAAGPALPAAQAADRKCFDSRIFRAGCGRPVLLRIEPFVWYDLSADLVGDMMIPGGRFIMTSSEFLECPSYSRRSEFHNYVSKLASKATTSSMYSSENAKREVGFPWSRNVETFRHFLYRYVGFDFARIPLLYPIAEHQTQETDCFSTKFRQKDFSLAQILRNALAPSAPYNVQET
ncbi:unnamed protein product [Nesidiocoris tenuis]|uniref:Uncharacterized protein n=1 Tax=Nesidiocoris tenuis TaxID=355587 RepID=A0A6H5HQE5_9HEMI|nr:unnamed protein product [Nesidiocoris tenuis]